MWYVPKKESGEMDIDNETSRRDLWQILHPSKTIDGAQSRDIIYPETGGFVIGRLYKGIHCKNRGGIITPAQWELLTNCTFHPSGSAGTS